MSDEFLLTPTDVAEALGCTRFDVLALIANGELQFASGNARRIAHSAVEEFVTQRRATALTLGTDVVISPTFATSRPSNDKAD